MDYSSEGFALSDSVDVVNALMHSDLERVYKIKSKWSNKQKVEKCYATWVEVEDATKGAYKTTKLKSMSFAPFLA